MKPFILAIAALGLAGTIGTANATPDTSNTVEIWNGIDPNGVETDLVQQALPGAAAAILRAGGDPLACGEHYLHGADRL